MEEAVKLSTTNLIEALEDAIAYTKGEKNAARVRHYKIPIEVDVKAIRTTHNLTQKEFAEKYRFPLSSIRNWEQKRRVPDTSAKILLKLIERDPALVEEVAQTLP